MKPAHASVSRRLLCTAIVSLLSLSACGKRGGLAAEAKESTAPGPPSPSAPGLVELGADAPELKQMTIETVRTVAMPGDEVMAPAKIEANPNRIGHPALPVPGRIVKVMVKLGDSVTKGQPLVTIESPAVAEAETAFLQAETSVRQAELACAKAQADQARLSDLLAHQAVAQKEELAAETASALARSGVEQARSAKDQAKHRLELLGITAGQRGQTVTVTSPLAGKVLEVSVVDGEFRNEISTPLMTIADLSRVWATSEVPESKIRYCRVGGAADLELIAYPGKTFRARVTRIADTVNGETRTIKVSAELDNPGGQLRPEMYGRLRSSDGTMKRPWVPGSAVVRIGEKDFVFVEKAPGRFLSTPIQLGQRHEEGYAVTGGLKAGDKLVTQGSIYLKALL